MLEVAIRADASIVIGSGHIMRCLTLAERLRACHANVFFITREHEGNLCDFIASKGFEVVRLAHPKEVAHEDEEKSEDASLYRHWLGTSQSHDAEQTIEIIKGYGKTVDILIVDHYALDYRWESVVSSYVKKIMVIDDLANRKHHCDVLLDQNYKLASESRYTHLVPESAYLLEGPKYALLRQEFVEARRELRKRQGTIQRILVFFGGSDPTNETSKAIDAIVSLQRDDLTVDVVVGTSNPNKHEIKQRVHSLDNFNYYEQINHMAELMALADLAIGAGGSTTWERCCLGLPALVVNIAENQKEITHNLALSNAVVDLGDAPSVTSGDIMRELRRVLDEPSMMEQWAENCLRLVDGKGTERVVDILLGRHLKVTVVSDENSWINEYIPALIKELEERGHAVSWIHKVAEIESGDIVYYLGCGQLAPGHILKKNKHNLVVHESDLPKGKGWSPLTWQILEGRNEIPITLFEAVEKVDSGHIYLKKMMRFEGHELIDELRKSQAEHSIELCLHFIDHYSTVLRDAEEQKGESTFYPRRLPKDSQLDVNKSILEQFNLLRVVDNERYPAFFELNGYRYDLKIEKSRGEQ